MRQSSRRKSEFTTFRNHIDQCPIAESMSFLFKAKPLITRPVSPVAKPMASRATSAPVGFNEFC
jgi:hypothetical protein